MSTAREGIWGILLRNYEAFNGILILVVRLPGVPGSPRRTRRRLPGVPGSKKNIYFFFFKMCNGKDSDMLVVIVGQYCSA